MGDQATTPPEGIVLPQSFDRAARLTVRERRGPRTRGEVGEEIGRPKNKKGMQIARTRWRGAPEPSRRPRVWLGE